MSSSIGQSSANTGWGSFDPGRASAFPGVVLTLGAGLGVLTAIDPGLGLAAAVASVLIGIFTWYPAAGLAALIASRSSLDAFQDATRMQAAFLFNPASALGILLIVMAVVLLGLRVRGRERVEWGGRPGLAWGGWIAFSALSVPVALVQLGQPGFAAAVREYVRLTSTFALYFLVINLARDHVSRKLMISGILLGLIAPTVAAIQQLITHDYTHGIDGNVRIYGTFVHPGQFGLYSAAIAMLCLGLWEDAWCGKTGRFWVSMTFVVSLTTTILTATRAAWGILLAALFIRACLLPRRQRIITLTVMLMVSAALAPLVAWRLQDLISGREGSPEVTNSFVWRLLNFRMLLGVFAQSPIVGHGLRATGIINPVRTDTAEGYERGFAAHSELIRVLVEQGFLGLIGYVTMAVLLVSSIKYLTFDRSKESTVVHTGVGKSLWAFLAASFALAPLGADLLSGTSFMYVILTVIGVLYASRAYQSPGPTPARGER